MCGPGRGQVGRPKRADKDKDKEKDKDKPPTEKEKHKDKEERASTPTVTDSRAERAEKRKGTVTASGSGKLSGICFLHGWALKKMQQPFLPFICRVKWKHIHSEMGGNCC